MGYLDKNINMVLVILVVGIVIVMLGVTIFFQLGLKSRTTDLDVTSGNLSTCTTQLANYQDRLQQCTERAESAIADIESYDKIYEQKVAELGETEDELVSAQRREKNLELIKLGLENENTQLKSEKNELQQDVKELNAEISFLKQDVNYWKDRFNCCEGSSTVDECRNSC